MTELPERRGFNPPTQKNFDAIKDRLTTGEDAQAATDALFPVTDDNLASPNNVAYRHLYTAGGVFLLDTAAGTYGLNADAHDGVTASGSTGRYFIFPLVGADFAVAGKTTKLRLRAWLGTNATALTITFTFGLYPLTLAGGADTQTRTLGTVVSGSTVAIANAAASDLTTAAGTDFTFPSDGDYVLGVVTSGTLTNNNLTLAGVTLQIRNT